MKRFLLIGLFVVGFLAYATIGAPYISNHLTPHPVNSNVINNEPNRCSQLTAKQRHGTACADPKCAKVVEALKDKFDQMGSAIRGQDKSQVPAKPSKDDFNQARKCSK